MLFRSLDAAFPAGLLALLMPSLRDRDTRLVALLGAAVAVALTPILPAGLPVLCALLGLAALFIPRRGRPAPAGRPGFPAAHASGVAHAGPDPVRQSGPASGAETEEASC